MVNERAYIAGLMVELAAARQRGDEDHEKQVAGELRRVGARPDETERAVDQPAVETRG